MSQIQLNRKNTELRDVSAELESQSNLNVKLVALRLDALCDKIDRAVERVIRPRVYVIDRSTQGMRRTPRL